MNTIIDIICHDHYLMPWKELSVKDNGPGSDFCVWIEFPAGNLWILDGLKSEGVYRHTYMYFYSGKGTELVANVCAKEGLNLMVCKGDLVHPVPLHLQCCVWGRQGSISWAHHCSADADVINPLRAKFFRGNINIYLHFVLFLHIDTTQVVEILPEIRQEPTYPT